MVRTNIYLTPRQSELLKAEAKNLGIGLAELVRRILDEHLKRQEQQA